MSFFPALDIRGAAGDMVLALLDDFAPTAVQELTDGLTVYFSNAAQRDAARTAVLGAWPGTVVASRDVDDEDWARRSQQNLTPVTVGRITVSPPWCVPAAAARTASSSAQEFLVIIQPSMGFGTGHHATTRLCLAALQRLRLQGASVLDVGTGSGVLALAAAGLGAREVVGVDFDTDAIQNAQENLTLNSGLAGVRFEATDLRTANVAPADVVIANLTGAVLVQNAARLLSLVGPEGTLVVSGLQTDEHDEVVAAFGPATLTWSAEEAGWVALAFNPTTRSGV